VAGVKKVITIIALLAVIVVAVALTVRMVRGGKLEPPERITGRRFEKIDAETLEIIALTGDEWKALGYKKERFKNPKTGKYTMARVGICTSCGAKIPWPELPVYPERGNYTQKEYEKVCDEITAKRAEIERHNKCPKCGAVCPIEPAAGYQPGQRGLPSERMEKRPDGRRSSDAR